MVNKPESYKTKVLIEFSNTAYLNITHDQNFSNVPRKIWDLWYSSEKDSIHSLGKDNDASDDRWKKLYEQFEKEFSKLH